uniref:Uncharacterized protein n=1 Tax=Kalanchoe fedtschenkoi TaxID=63787 RepID=A0A7N0T8X2_KALFE
MGLAACSFDTSLLEKKVRVLVLYCHSITQPPGYTRTTMLSSSLLDIVAGSSNTLHHHHQHLQESLYSHIFSDHNAGYNLHHPNPVAKDLQDDHVPLNSGRVTIITPEPAVALSKKKSDNRSKIRTAKGLRDRRVRLSIGIARKFFDLQDLLGFDKPSRTLEWLLKNSSKAILELSAASSSSTPPQGKAAAGVVDGFKGLSSSRSTTAYSTNQAELLSCDTALKTMKRKAAALLLAKESREKARARARARTAAKLHTAGKSLDHQKSRLLNNHTPYWSADRHYFSSSSLIKLLDNEIQKEEIKAAGGGEQHKQKLQIQLYNYNYGIGSNFESALNPSLSLDWDISSVLPPPSSSAAPKSNFSGDIDIYSRANWD